MPDRQSVATSDFVAELTPCLEELVDLPTPSQFLGLLTVLLLKIAKLRLFEAGDVGRTKLFESPLPSPADLDPFIDAFLQISPEARPSRAPGTSDPISPDVRNIFLSFRNAFAHNINDAALARDTTLDIILDRATRSWSIDLVANPGDLRGDDLSELLGRVPTPPVTTPMPEFDLPRDSYISSAGAAKLLGVAKSTVTRRIERNEIIGFRVFKHALRIPKDQFIDFDVVPGIREVLALFALPGHAPSRSVDHRGAWIFLNTDLFAGDPDPRPIDRLRNAARTHDTERVLVDLTRAKQSLDRGDHL